jgi:hypothetical protein
VGVLVLVLVLVLVQGWPRGSRPGRGQVWRRAWGGRRALKAPLKAFGAVQEGGRQLEGKRAMKQGGGLAAWGA